MTRIIKSREVKSVTSVPRSTMYRLIIEGRFPKPVKMGRSSGWLENEIQQWVADRVSERDGGGNA